MIKKKLLKNLSVYVKGECRPTFLFVFVFVQKKKFDEKSEHKEIFKKKS
jgi:hypothetical protein